MMQVVGYEFRTGSVFQSGAKADPKVVGEALESLRQQFKGELTPEDVVETARSKNHPLHAYFEWDDAAGAHQHRLAQARGLIRCVVAVYHTPKPETPYVKAHAFTHVPEGETSHYRATTEVMRVKNTREAVLRRAWDELLQWRRRYKDLAEFASIFATADEVSKKLPSSITKSG
jgi:hypothetical protein